MHTSTRLHWNAPQAQDLAQHFGEVWPHRWLCSGFVGSRDHTQACRDRIDIDIFSDESAFGEQLKVRLRREAGRLGERTTEIGSEGVAEDAGSFVTGDQDTAAGAFPTEDSSVAPENVDADLEAVDVFRRLDKKKTRTPWCLRTSEHASWPTVEQQQGDLSKAMLQSARS